MNWVFVVVVAAMCVLVHRLRSRAESFAALGPSSVRAYVISMPNARSRKSIEKRLRATVPDVQFFDGIDGSTQPRMGTLQPGEIGCAMSHMKLWSDLSHTDVPFIVFEDDAKPTPDFRARLEYVLEQIDESIDMVFLGHCFDNAKDEYAPGLKVSAHPRCMHGYLVTPNGARKLASWASRAKPTMPIDEELARLIVQGDVRALSCEPACVNTTGETSVIDSMGPRGG